MFLLNIIFFFKSFTANFPTIWAWGPVVCFLFLSYFPSLTCCVGLRGDTGHRGAAQWSFPLAVCVLLIPGVEEALCLHHNESQPVTSQISACYSSSQLPGNSLILRLLTNRISGRSLPRRFMVGYAAVLFFVVILLRLQKKKTRVCMVLCSVLSQR